jgi:hypothetical protein
MAIRFENAFGVKADTLMRMEAAHALAGGRAREDEIVMEAALAVILPDDERVTEAGRRRCLCTVSPSPSIHDLIFPVIPAKAGIQLL